MSDVNLDETGHTYIIEVQKQDTPGNLVLGPVHIKRVKKGAKK